MSPSPEPIFHICLKSEWESARQGGVYPGSSQDAPGSSNDGFIHFSSRDQVRASAAKHRAGQAGLVLLRVDPSALGGALKWEPARGGMLFPHLYGALPLAAVREVSNLPLDGDGHHVFPPEFSKAQGPEGP